MVVLRGVMAIEPEVFGLMLGTPVSVVEATPLVDQLRTEDFPSVIDGGSALRLQRKVGAGATYTDVVADSYLPSGVLHKSLKSLFLKRGADAFVPDVLFANTSPPVETVQDCIFTAPHLIDAVFPYPIDASARETGLELMNILAAG